MIVGGAGVVPCWGSLFRSLGVGLLSCIRFVILFSVLYEHLKAVCSACSPSVMSWPDGERCPRAGNVLLTSAAGSAHGFSAKIGDLGLSRQMEIQSRIQTQTSGTVTYMAPEVLSDGFVSKVGGRCLQGCL